MLSKESTLKTIGGQIRITKVPSGEAPLEIRKAWVGLVLPCDPYLGYPDDGLDRGILSGKEVSRNRCGFSVPQDQAIEILEKEYPLAAAWWKANGFPQGGDKRFGFAEEEAEIISGVTRSKIRLYDEMEGLWGDPNR